MSQTLFSKHGNAFWDAFSRPSGGLHPNGAPKQEWDVGRHCRGAHRRRRASSCTEGACRERGAEGPGKDKCAAVVTDLLSESMASSTLSRKLKSTLHLADVLHGARGSSELPVLRTSRPAPSRI